ncbi:MAG TPA: 2-oxo-4-hydroxy-4-carboxy-5-ureidoimidazoline decarboxylase, partial [Gemmatimonadaceae bacterium]|nr:2-oxo-4-hydroxy-4-carboxy-5-ureidoimidazoline decarboxylase [Gemmatimonadaceae bacterium]
AREQAAARSASTSTQQQLDEINRAYEKKFGHIYIVCATGKSAEEMLEIARKRMSNDADSELHAAAEEQRKIMQLRLGKLLGENQ